MLLRCLPSFDGKLEHFVTKKWKKRLPNSSQADYSSRTLSSLTYILLGCKRGKLLSECKQQLQNVKSVKSRPTDTHIPNTQQPRPNGASYPFYFDDITRQVFTKFYLLSFLTYSRSLFSDRCGGYSES